MIDLSGKIALVTGGSRGIGRAISLNLADCGADIVVSYKENKVTAREVAQEIEGRGRRCALVQGNVALPEDTERIVETAIQSFGRIDILVNNAGFNRDTLILRMALEDWDEVMNVNLRGPFLCTKAALKHMIRQRGGRIINIGSLSGVAGQAGQANYSSAKAGLIGFTKAVAREVGSRGITANIVAPGLIETDLTHDVPPEFRQEAIRRAALGRLGKPEDVAAAVTFLASDEASYITGQLLVVDGGLGL